jgi:hypothetical protein
MPERNRDFDNDDLINDFVNIHALDHVSPIIHLHTIDDFPVDYLQPVDHNHLESIDLLYKHHSPDEHEHDHFYYNLDSLHPAFNVRRHNLFRNHTRQCIQRDVDRRDPKGCDSLNWIHYLVLHR